MTEPLVSVIIPSHDRPMLLRNRSIPSVLRQGYRNWEILVVGDGPKTGALSAVVDSFGDPRIRYTEIPRPDYGGMSKTAFWHCAGAAARNYGLSLARGSIIAPLDDDDEFTPGHLAECAAVLSDGGADFVYGSVLVRDFETGRDRVDYFPWSDPGTPALLRQRNLLFHSSVCYSARYKDLRYPEDGDVPADYGLWKAILQSGARCTSLDTHQAVYYGDNLSGAIRTSMPTLPPLDAFQDLLRGIYESRTLSNGGPVVQALEAALSAYLDAPHVITAPSGDVAMMVALKSLSTMLPPGRREVVLPSYAHPSLINAVLWNGLIPVFCDIDARTLCMTAETAAPHVGQRTGIIAVLHPHGFAADMLPLRGLARDCGAFIVADAAAALGAGSYGRRIGGFGDVEVFSLSGTKTLTAGEGGVICCRDEKLAEVLRRTARYGLGPDSQVEEFGVNGKLAEIPAALALAGLPHLDEWIARRRRMEERYRQRLAELPGLRMIRPSHDSAEGTCKDMVLILPDPAAARALSGHLASYRIVTRPYYRVLHRMPAYRWFQRVPLPETDRIADCTVCVPLYSHIREAVVDFVAEAVREALR